MTKAFDKLSDGTAPHNEMDRREPAQRDDGEATDPEGARRRMEMASNLPDGFYMSRDSKGKPLAKPTRENTRELLDSCVHIFAEREMREEELPDFSPTVTPPLNKLVAEMHKVNEFAANGFVYGIVREAAQRFANAVRWFEIHARNVERQSDNGNETGAENALINAEATRKQMFAEAALLDWCMDQGVEPDLSRGVDAALGLAGWQLTNSQQSQSRKASHNTTRELLWSRPPAEPDEAIEATEEELDEAIG